MKYAKLWYSGQFSKQKYQF